MTTPTHMVWLPQVTRQCYLSASEAIISTTAFEPGYGVLVSHLKETPTPGPPLSVSSVLLCNFVEVYLTFVQFYFTKTVCTLLCTFY